LVYHELFLLHLGQLGEHNPSTGVAEYNQVPGYLIRTATGRTVLVDSGNPKGMIGQPTSAPWMDLLNITRPEDDVAARLGQLGLRPEDIDLLISTHFDFDHCGRHDLFAAAGTESVVQRAQIETARADSSRHDPTLWNLPGLRYTEIDGDLELEPGLTLLSTPGHANGHQSVLVETAVGPVILAIDAISHAEMIETREIPDWYADREQALASIDRLTALARQTGATLIFGHEAPQWATLPMSPAPFTRP
jgi:N-acyl homoserine lactone hydrolase